MRSTSGVNIGVDCAGLRGDPVIHSEQVVDGEGGSRGSGGLKVHGHDVIESQRRVVLHVALQDSEVPSGIAVL